MNTKDYFSYLGEAWRDMLAIEFLMRVAIAKKEGEEKKFPKPPYVTGKVYVSYPAIFEELYFSGVQRRFNQIFPSVSVPDDIVKLRNAMAHGIVAHIDQNDSPELVKFKKMNGNLKIELGLVLNEDNLKKVQVALVSLRRQLAGLV